MLAGGGSGYQSLPSTHIHPTPSFKGQVLERISCHAWMWGCCGGATDSFVDHYCLLRRRSPPPSFPHQGKDLFVLCRGGGIVIGGGRRLGCVRLFVRDQKDLGGSVHPIFLSWDIVGIV